MLTANKTYNYRSAEEDESAVTHSTVLLEGNAECAQLTRVRAEEVVQNKKKIRKTPVAVLTEIDLHVSKY